MHGFAWIDFSSKFFYSKKNGCLQNRPGSIAVYRFHKGEPVYPPYATGTLLVLFAVYRDKAK
jgi:hypothetical protein